MKTICRNEMDDTHTLALGMKFSDEILNNFTLYGMTVPLIVGNNFRSKKGITHALHTQTI